MSTPQQPELARSGRGATDPASAKARAATALPEPDGPGPIPEDNRPGHHPEVEQDKPVSPPPPGGAGHPVDFEFAFDRRFAPVARMFGVTPGTARISVARGELAIRFGPWSLRTPLENVAGAEITGPYTWYKVIGPPHISLADRGVTFATTTDRGVCIRFHRPVPAALPGGFLKHPAATVTPTDADLLVETLKEATA